MKVRLSDLTRVGNLTLGSGTDYLTSAAIDEAGGFAYFSTGTAPDLTSTGIVVKIRLSNFTVAGTLTLKSGEKGIAAAAIDVAGGYAYFGLNYPSHSVVRIRLSDFSENGSLNEDFGITSAVIDSARGYALFGTNIGPHGYLVKIRLSDFTNQGYSDLTWGEGASAVIDPEGGSVYLGTTLSDGSSSWVEKVSLTDYTQAGVLTLNSGEYGLFSGVIDNLHGYAYFGTDTWPGIIVKIQVAGPPAVPAVLTAVPAVDKIKLSWSAAQTNGRAITGYKLYRGTTSGGEILLTSLGNQTSFDDTSVVNGTTYYYKVSALNSFGEGLASDEASAGPATPPSAPLLFDAQSGPGVIYLNWSAPASNGNLPITGYKIYRADYPKNETYLTSVNNVTTYTDHAVTLGKYYYYKVTATNQIGTGPASNESWAKPNAATTSLLLLPATIVLFVALVIAVKYLKSWRTIAGKGLGTRDFASPIMTTSDLFLQRS